MNASELKHLILQMRRIGDDTQTCEVKEARSKIPESITDTLSAFSNGNGDRKLTQYEIDRLMEEHSQPTFDDEIVAQATLDDLDHNLLSRFINRQRELHPRIFGTRSDENITISMHVAKKDDEGTIRPTLGGLLTLGSFPQQFFPRLISLSPLSQVSPKPK